MMKLRGLLIATAVLAALAGTLYWSNHRKPSDSTVKAAVDTAPKVLSLKQADISQLDIKKQGNPEVALEKTDGTWRLTKPDPLGADQDAVTSVLSTLSALDSERLIEEKPSDLSAFGLKNPTLEVDVTGAGNKVHKLLIGDETPAGNAYYVAVAGDPRVFTIANYNESSMDKTADDLRDKRLLTADFDKASQIVLSTPKQSIEFGRNKDEWQIVGPRPMRADSFQVDELVRTLRDAKMQLEGTPSEQKKQAAGFSSGKEIATVKVSALSGTQELQVRKVKDDYFAKSSVIPGIYKVPSNVGMGLDKKLGDFLNKKLFDFGYTDPDKMEVHDGAKSNFLTRSGTDWWGPDGKKLDLDSADDLLEKIRDLSADKFPESGFTKPEIEITVISNDKKRTEQVFISKAGENYIAKRDGESELYEIPASSITELQKAAAAVKPAAPPAAPAHKK
ncbi:MAG TPA: DUF4340 domain-containing protein [Candidatus Acidoferrum sp.]|nr:DUF4340 domain-containing protein [Candidatus Acidoferrum sp.]